MKQAVFRSNERLKALFKDTFSLAQYQGMCLVLKIILIIFQIPFILLAALLYVYYMIVYVTYRILNAPVTYLEGFVRDEGKDVKHATQFIIYFIGFPVMLLLEVMMAFTALYLFVLLLVLNIVCYIISFGGISFNPYLDEETIIKETKPFIRPKLAGWMYVLVIVIMVAMFFVIGYFAFGEVVETACVMMLVGLLLGDILLACLTKLLLKLEAATYKEKVVKNEELKEEVQEEPKDDEKEE